MNTNRHRNNEIVTPYACICICINTGNVQHVQECSYHSRSLHLIVRILFRVHVKILYCIYFLFHHYYVSMVLIIAMVNLLSVVTLLITI
jgi:hypothetical protein